MSTINSDVFRSTGFIGKRKRHPDDLPDREDSNAIAVAIKRDMGGSENTIVEIDPVKRRFM